MDYVIKRMNPTKLLVLIPFLVVPAALGSPAHSQVQQSSSSIAPGMTVKDPAGGVVGTVKSVDGDYLIIRTDKHEAKLPRTSFRLADGVLLGGLTQAQLNAGIEAAIAKAKAQVVAGATVYGSGGQTLGTVDSLADGQFTLKLTTGQLVQLPINSVAPSEKGLVLGMTAQQLKAAVDSAQNES